MLSLFVAPRAGAWIETALSDRVTMVIRSPLAQGRGLKLQDPYDLTSQEWSPLAQGRGLKRKLAKLT